MTRFQFAGGSSSYRLSIDDAKMIFRLRVISHEEIHFGTTFVARHLENMCGHRFGMCRWLNESILAEPSEMAES